MIFLCFVAYAPNTEIKKIFLFVFFAKVWKMFNQYILEELLKIWTRLELVRAPNLPFWFLYFILSELKIKKKINWEKIYRRTTRFLTEEGFYNFHNWFDDRAWYPLGRIIGGTIYPGLMITSGVLYRLMWLVNITIDIRNVCVFLAPFFSSLTTIVTYLLTKEIHVCFIDIDAVWRCKFLNSSPICL